MSRFLYLLHCFCLFVDIPIIPCNDSIGLICCFVMIPCDTFLVERFDCNPRLRREGDDPGVSGLNRAIDQPRTRLCTDEAVLHYLERSLFI
jgi:hypothetical protein